MTLTYQQLNTAISVQPSETCLREISEYHTIVHSQLDTGLFLVPLKDGYAVLPFRSRYRGPRTIDTARMLFIASSSLTEQRQGQTVER